MPGRPHPIITDHIYHIFNKSIDHKRIFDDEKFSKIFLDIIRYYRSTNSYLRYSNYRKLSSGLKYEYEKKLEDKRSFSISILAYCVMPTHYHLLLRQNQNNGIPKFASQIQNSFTKYLNLVLERKGSIFLQTYKSEPIISEEQLKHVCRYIHLNPYSGGVITNQEDIESYPWSSFGEYTSSVKTKISQPESILSMFNNNIDRYRSFVLDNAEHQKTLEYCKYTNKW